MKFQIRKPLKKHVSTSVIETYENKIIIKKYLKPTIKQKAICQTQNTNGYHLK
jgi:hypothetical protein